MTQNIAPYYTSGNPLNLYKPNQLPFEAMISRPVSTMPSNGSGNFADLVNHIHTHRMNHKKPQMSHNQIKESLLQHTRKQGMSDAEGAGFWGDVWSGIKSVGSKLGNAAVSGVSHLLSHPNETINSISGLMGQGQQAMSHLASLAPLLL